MLDAESLCSKWGFGDGGALDDWWWDTYDDDAPLDTEELLYALVAAYLVPAIREAGHVVELERISTNHNPVRARTLDGGEVDHYDGSRDHFNPEILVTVTREQIEDLAEKITPGYRSNDPEPAG
ncbi:MAG: hypothetical protein CMH34_09890 [Microbacterium sp.]|nr:hypothetical protein [Microbacterium sp.]